MTMTSGSRSLSLCEAIDLAGRLLDRVLAIRQQLDSASAALARARADCDAWRLVAAQAIHALHERGSNADKVQAAYRRLLDEQRGERRPYTEAA
jgi:hypothetical protein